MDSINYFCSGSLAFAILYFIKQKEWKKLNNPDDAPPDQGMLDAVGDTQDTDEGP